jgi:superfamily II DNA or RNA helicase
MYFGNIYIYWQKILNNFKSGSTGCFDKRMSTLKTSCDEFNNLTHVIWNFKIIKSDYSCYQLDDIINKLSTEYNYPFIKHNGTGGTEFYKKDDFNKLCDFFDKINVEYELEKIDVDNLRENIKMINIDEIKENEDIDFLNDKNKKLITKNELNNIITKLELNKNIKEIPIPYKHQINVLDKIKDEFNINNILKLYWSCGLGKTLLSIFICEKMNFNTICIGVPSIFLQSQFINEILKFYSHENILCIGGNNENSTTNQEEIIKFINNNINKKFIISTYSSCHLLISQNIKIDFKIGDECHHLVGLENDENIGYKQFHKIQSNKTFFMTATQKIIDIKDNKIIYTMNNDVQFGKLIDEKSVLWAIENKKITDYNLLLIGNKESEIDKIINNIKINVTNKELFISAFMALKSIEKYDNLTHILICCNTTENADIINTYINLILEKKIINIDKNDIYTNSIHSNKKININLNDKNNEIEKFKKSKYGIISSVYIFGEGFDLPKLSGVVFAENMHSDIRILQTSLRPNRLDKDNPNKKAFIIIPYIEGNEISFSKIRMIVCKLRNSDETIEQKIKYLTIKELENEENKENEENEENNEEKEIKNIKYGFTENHNELNKIKLRLKTSKSLSSNNSEEQDEYDYVKEINKSLNIQSKEEYTTNEIKNKHENYIENPHDYFRIKVVWTNWYDFLGIDTSKFIQTKKEWINYCNKININSLEDYNNASIKYECLPKNPGYFYDDFTYILCELNILNIERR